MGVTLPPCASVSSSAKWHHSAASGVDASLATARPQQVLRSTDTCAASSVPSTFCATCSEPPSQGGSLLEGAVQSSELRWAVLGHAPCQDPEGEAGSGALSPQLPF